MAISNLNENVKIISALADKPTLTSAELKEKFDMGSEIIKNYINKTLVPSINENNVVIVNNLTTGGSDKVASAEMVKKLNTEKQAVIKYGESVPVLDEGEIFIEIIS